MAGTKKIMVMNANVNDKDLEFMKDVIEAGKVVPVIDRCYPLVEIPEAFRYLGKNMPEARSSLRWGEMVILDNTKISF